MSKVPLLTRDQNTYNKIDYYEFEELILQRVCETVGLLVRTDYELSYKSRKRNRSWYYLEEEDFEEFIKEYYRLTSSNKKHLILDDESNLDEIDLMKGEIHKKLKEKHGYCYIKDDRHLPLTTLHLSMWTDEIYKNHCDYETPLPHPNFGMENSLKVPSSNQSSTASASNKFINCLIFTL
ncbi:hypothetical protein RhiirA4_537596 [Rhizophagus irregularis]|uniref:Uncharacterized protein n=1 Tax=Rhizophagus irregularis TaxID=588596 RepID=A0A2I1FWS0_9GLOM|nr:hypothetical protein RhiirA4_537596 [Rhizophagus irregularis]